MCRSLFIFTTNDTKVHEGFSVDSRVSSAASQNFRRCCFEEVLGYNSFTRVGLANRYIRGQIGTTMKPTTPDLKPELFACRRYYEADHRRNDTVEKRQKREWIEKWVLGILAAVFTPIMIAIFVYVSRNYAPREPLPWQLGVSMYCVILISTPSCFITIGCLVLPKPGFGRWIIVNAGMFHRYGKSPHRFVPFSSLRSVRVERPKSRFAVIVFETDHEPLRISPCTFSSNKPNDDKFLPFGFRQDANRHL